MLLFLAIIASYVAMRTTPSIYFSFSLSLSKTFFGVGGGGDLKQKPHVRATSIVAMIICSLVTIAVMP